MKDIETLLDRAAVLASIQPLYRETKQLLDVQSKENLLLRADAQMQERLSVEKQLSAEKATAALQRKSFWSGYKNGTAITLAVGTILIILSL